MNTNKLKKFERAPVTAILPDTAAERQKFIDELVIIGEKLPFGVVSGESLKDILTAYKKTRVAIINAADGNRVAVADGVTKILTEL